MATFTARRPTSDQRRTAMLQAAAEMFFEHGYAATSIDSIIERLGGSKRSIYNEFRSKEGLFTALVSDGADRALAALAVDEIGDRDLRTTLLRFARQLMTIYMSPTVIGLYRIVMAEAQRFPALAEAFYAKGPGRAAGRLAEVLEAASAKGQIRSLDCVLAANHFVAMIRDNLHLQVVLGLREPLTPDEIDADITSAVDIFYRGLRRT